MSSDPCRIVPRRLSLLLGMALLIATACTVGPDYQRPVVDTGEGWSEPSFAGSSDAEPSEAASGIPDPPVDRWWAHFGDPTLEGLVEEALAGNPEIAQATARVAEARALLAVAGGSDLPQIAVTGSVTRQRLAEDGFLPVERIPGFEADQTLYDAAFDASWEPDLFGRTRRAVESAGARLGESAARRAGVRLTVTAEVARMYLELRGAQSRLAALGETVAAARRTTEVVGLQVVAGEVAEARLAQAAADLTALEASLPPVSAEIRAAALSLGVLTGGLPEDGLELIRLPAPRVSALPLAPLPVGERAELLRRRPDVVVAERRLAAATADIGLATAELFPRLSIQASGGFQAMDPTDLGGSGSEVWSLVPFLSWRIFDRGRVRAEIRATEARTEAAALAYEAVVRQALADAERALTRYRHGLDALEKQNAAVAAARENRRYARLRHEAGAVPLFELLDAERALARALEAQARVHTRAATDLVAVFKALGGGWENPQPPVVSELSEEASELSDAGG